MNLSEDCRWFHTGQDGYCYYLGKANVGSINALGDAIGRFSSHALLRERWLFINGKPRVTLDEFITCFRAIGTGSTQRAAHYEQ